MTKQVKVPLTEFSIVKNATINFQEKGYVIESKLVIREGKNTLFLEMGTNNVPKGPWSNYVGGSVQVVINVGSLEPKTIMLTEKDTEKMHIINNFGGVKGSNKKIDANLSLNVSEDQKITITGFIKLYTDTPKTYQEITLDNNVIPILTVKDYIYNRYDPNSPYALNAEKVYQSVLRKTKPQ